MTKRVVGSVIIATMVYPAFSFIAWDFDVSGWTADGRLALVFFTLLTFVGSITFPLWDD